MNEGFELSKKEGHLKEGIRPIMTCIGTPVDFGTSSTRWIFNHLPKPGSLHNVEFHGSTRYFESKNFLNGGSGTYVFSSLDDKDKFSESFCDCTGLIVAGVDKKTGQNISFLSHQYPQVFLFEKKDDFIKDLNELLLEAKKRCVSKTVDAVIVGGNYSNGINSKKISYKQSYLDSIELLSKEVKNVLGFEPSVVNGPKGIIGSDNVFYDNENKRLYFMRVEVNPDTGNFTQSDIDKEKDKWEK